MPLTCAGACTSEGGTNCGADPIAASAIPRSLANRVEVHLGNAELHHFGAAGVERRAPPGTGRVGDGLLRGRGRDPSHVTTCTVQRSAYPHGRVRRAKAFSPSDLPPFTGPLSA
jgi:hypothetical protein